MFFKVLILLQVFLAFNQAEPVRRFQSQTVVTLTLEPSAKLKVCQCSGNKCTLDAKAAEEACQAFKVRFQYFGHPSPYFMLCEFTKQSCKEVSGNVPKKVYVDLIFDRFYLNTAPFFFGQKTGRQLLLQMFQRNDSMTPPAMEKKPLAMKIWGGATGLPVEFSATLNVKPDEAAKLEECCDSSCHARINQLCREFITGMKATVARLMDHFLGCHIRRIYTVGNEAFMTWSMMFHHRNLIEKGVVKTREQLEEMIYRRTKHIKMPSIVKSFEVTGIVPLDYCEVRATSTTTQKYSDYMRDPTSYRYRTTSHAYFSRVVAQIMAGDNKSPSCIRRTLGFEITDNKKMAKVSMGLWISLTCYKQRGLKTCNEVIKDLAESWKRGTKILHDSWANDYQFTLQHAGLSYEE